MASWGERRDPRAVAAWVKRVSPRACPPRPPPGYRPALLLPDPSWRRRVQASHTRTHAHTHTCPGYRFPAGKSRQIRDSHRHAPLQPHPLLICHPRAPQLARGAREEQEGQRCQIVNHRLQRLKEPREPTERRGCHPSAFSEALRILKSWAVLLPNHFHALCFREQMPQRREMKLL